VPRLEVVTTLAGRATSGGNGAPRAADAAIRLDLSTSRLRYRRPRAERRVRW
jgi:hypothetical protein